jgi:cytochrome c oxidase subunit II
MSPDPLGYLDAAGQRADTILPLTWLTIIISTLVVIIIAALLWVGIRRGRVADGGAAETRAAPVMSGGSSGNRWISLGLALSAVPLLVTLVWTMVALAEVSGPPRNPALTLDVTARQWWWQVQYDSARPDEVFTTANEIHIPVGRAVLVRLHGDDVIHSFWVPKLSGKTDTIPGQTNVAWLEAREPGIYRGQCSEYCGVQHAHMAFEVVAESPEDFERWRAHQLESAAPPTTPEQVRGEAFVQYRCGLCHRVQGTTADAISAPDLTHLMSRRTIAAGSLLNAPGNLASWIQGPQELKPGNLMPDQGLTGEQLADTLAYLETLQ